MNNQVKIAIIGSRGYPIVYSGYETFVKELAERLVKNGVLVTVYCHRGLFNERPKQKNGINLVYIRTSKRKSLSQLIHSFQSIIHAVFSDCDIILVVNSANGPFGIITKLIKKKTIINVDGLEWLRPKWKGMGARYFYWASKMSTRLYDIIVNDSFAMADIYLKEFKAKSTVIAYGANIRYSQNEDIIKKWGLEKNDYYLVVGRMIPDNNADILVREFMNSNTKKKLVVVGDVPYKDKYATDIKSIMDHRVVFTGYVNDQSDLAELYHNCFAYLHGHEFGGTNPTMLKALAYGCAVLALETVFTREMCDGEKYALYFSKDNKNLCALINSLDTDDSKLLMLREISRNRILENYTWEKITNQYQQLFNTMIDNAS